MTRITTRIITGCLCIALLSFLAITPAAAQASEERFVVELDETGDAIVSVTFAYDLETDEEAAAFEELRENRSAPSGFADRFETQMSGVVADTSAATDRQMDVEDVRIDLHRTDGVGVVALSMTWSNLAATEDDRVVLTEPFASGFEPDRAFTVVVPDGYQIESASPTPTDRDDTSATWDADTTLAGFEVVATDGTTDETMDGENASGDGTEDAPGFGFAVAGIGLLVASLLSARRSGHDGR